jgi:putative PEP-CTERM system histidine kinase
MLESILSIVAILLLLSVAVYTVKREMTVANSGLIMVCVLCALIEAADSLSLRFAASSPTYFVPGLFLQSLLPATLLFCSFTLHRQYPLKSLSPFWWGLLFLTFLFPLSVLRYPPDRFFFAPDIGSEKMLFLGRLGYWFYTGIMCAAVLALINLESVFVTLSGNERWKTKFEFIGIFCILAFLVFYYSQGLLYRTINMNLLAVRSAVMIISLLSIGYSRFFRGGDVRVAVSRFVMYRSLSLILVGGYIITLAVIGEGMRYFGMSFGRNIAIFIAFAAGGFVMTVLLSGRLRRRVKVFVNKNFYAQKFDYRNAWIKFTEKLATCRNILDVEEAIMTTFTDTFELHGVALYLRIPNSEGFRITASRSMPQNQTYLKLSPALTSYFTDRGRVLNPNDVEYECTEEESSFVKQSGAYVIVPLIANRTIEGLAVFGRQLSGEDYIYEDYDLMKMISQQAALSIVNFRLSEELAETREIAAVAKVSSFIIHDLKNYAYTLSLLLENSETHIEDSSFQLDMIDTVRNTVASMKDIIERLKGIPEKDKLDTALIDISVLARDTATEMNKYHGDSVVIIGGSPVYAVVDAEEIRKVILNIMLNAADAISGKGRVTVSSGINGDHGYVRIEDNGCGMAEGFVAASLFKPFRSTKKKGLGIGLYQCKQIVEAHSGRIEVQSALGKGSVFTIHLPNSVAP